MVQALWPVELRESPKGRASPLESPGPRSPPLPQIVLAPEQSLGGHLIPACGGSWLSPQPFDWAAVMRERETAGGEGQEGAAAIAYTAVTPPRPAPSSLSGKKSGTEGVGAGSGRGPREQEGTPEVTGLVWAVYILPGSPADQRGLGTPRGELEVSVA